MRPLISFITPVYNTEKYLPQCIESVIKQTNGDWELILVDDGSVDSSGEICNNYASLDSRIMVIHKRNGGQFDSRLRGIQEAKGAYCTGLDSDDYLEPDCVEQLNKVINKADYDIVAWNMRSVEDGIEISTTKMEKYGQYSREEFLEYIIRSTDHSFCNKLFRTQLLRDAFYGNVPFSARHSEDFILISPAICMSRKIIAFDKVLYNYRQISGSVTHLYSAKRILDYLNSSVCIREILKYYGLDSPTIIEAENISLVNSVGYSLKRSFKEGAISKAEADEIRTHPLFSELVKYEKKKYTTYDMIALIKLFRYKMYFMIPIIFRGRKWMN